MAATYFGWGKAATYILRIPKRASASPLTMIWLGWAFSLLVFQLLHIFFPLNVFVVVPVFAVGIILCIARPSDLLHMVSKKPFAWVVACTSTLFLVASWIALRSMLTPINGDSGLYHFNSIRWINSFPIVPGLGNLHDRLAFNQSLFTYVGSLNFYPFLNHGRGLANSFLFLLIFTQIITRLASTFQKPAALTKSHPFGYAADLLALPLLGYLALSSDGLASPTPDLASSLLQLSMFLMLVHGIGEWEEEEKQQEWRAGVLIILAATAITVKLSNLGFTLIIVCICLTYTLHHHRKYGSKISRVLRLLLPAFVVLIVWCFRGIILSGYPLYPSTFGHVSFDWDVPPEKVEIMTRWVYSWARRPGVDENLVNGSWNWLGLWARVIVHNIVGVVYPVLSATAFCVFAVVSRRLFFSKKKALAVRNFDWIILFPLMGGLIYWFFMAPDPRFAHALFWLLPVGSALLLLSSLQPFLKTRSLFLVLGVVFLVLNLHFVFFAYRNRHDVLSFSVSGWHPVPTGELIEKRTLSGLVIYTPTKDAGCWDSPLPCTFTHPNYFSPNLRLRIPGKLGSGFTVRVPQISNPKVELK